MREVGPAIVVTPDTDLVDFQSVNVSGTGFPADSLLGILQCEESEAFVECDGSGTWSATLAAENRLFKDGKVEVIVFDEFGGITGGQVRLTGRR